MPFFTTGRKTVFNGLLIDTVVNSRCNGLFIDTVVIVCNGLLESITRSGHGERITQGLMDTVVIVFNGLFIDTVVIVEWFTLTQWS